MSVQRCKHFARERNVTMKIRNCFRDTCRHLTETLFQNIAFLILDRKCHLTRIFGARNDFIIFNVQNNKYIFDTKNACYMTFYKIFCKFENVL